jgi:hypothetical protein
VIGSLNRISKQLAPLPGKSAAVAAAVAKSNQAAYSSNLVNASCQPKGEGNVNGCNRIRDQNKDGCMEG